MMFIDVSKTNMPRIRLKIAVFSFIHVSLKVTELLSFRLYVVLLLFLGF